MFKILEDFFIDKAIKKVSKQVIKAHTDPPFQLGQLPLPGKRTAVRQRRLVRCAKARSARCVGDKESLDKTKRGEQVKLTKLKTAKEFEQKTTLTVTLPKSSFKSF